jgi:ankyrin repeat protein
MMAHWIHSVSLVLAVATGALLLGSGCQEPPPKEFFDDIAADNVEAVRASLEAHPDWAKASAPDPCRTPALFLAVLEDKAMVEAFLAKGADVNVRNASRATPLYWVCTAHGDTSPFRKEIAELLIAKGADVNARDDWGSSPLLKAVPGCGTSGVQLLIDAGADVKAKNDLDRTPLHEASLDGGVAELLIAHDADIEARDYQGDTPLLYAARIGSVEFATVLLAHGADVNARNSAGQTPLLLAQRTGKQVLIDLLIAHGAEVDARDKKGNLQNH